MDDQFRYFARVDDLETSESHGYPLAVYRFQVTDARVVSERWAGEAWVPDDELVRWMMTGSPDDFEPIAGDAPLTPGQPGEDERADDPAGEQAAMVKAIQEHRAALALFAKHLPGLHDQREHGNWAEGIIPQEAGLRLPLQPKVYHDAGDIVNNNPDFQKLLRHIYVQGNGTESWDDDLSEMIREVAAGHGSLADAWDYWADSDQGVGYTESGIALDRNAALGLLQYGADNNVLPDRVGESPPSFDEFLSGKKPGEGDPLLEPDNPMAWKGTPWESLVPIRDRIIQDLAHQNIEATPERIARQMADDMFSREFPDLETAEAVLRDLDGFGGDLDNRDWLTVGYPDEKFDRQGALAVLAYVRDSGIEIDFDPDIFNMNGLHWLRSAAIERLDNQLGAGEYGRDEIVREMVNDLFDNELSPELIAAQEDYLAADPFEDYTSLLTDSYYGAYAAAELIAYARNHPEIELGPFVQSEMKDGFLRFTDTGSIRNWIDEHYSDWADEVSGTEFGDAIQQYTGSYFDEINNMLRRDEYPASGVGDISYLVDVLDEGLDGVAAPADILVYRGVKGKYVQGLEVGDEFVDNGFASCSLSEEFAAGWGKLAYYEIRVPKGTRGAVLEKLTSIKGEFEFLFDRGTKFRVVDKFTRQGSSVAVLEVIGQDHGWEPSVEDDYVADDYDQLDEADYS